MSFVPTPQLPLFRVTLFYGPEPAADEPARFTCVFNVKKRSWKGGVQIAVDVSATHVARLQQAVAFDDWIHERLTGVQQAERLAYESRARDVFVQEICSMKLTFALERDIRQENGSISIDKFVDALDQNIKAAGDRIKLNVSTELDISQ